MLPLQACKERCGFMLVFVFQAALFKDSLQVADGMVVLLLPSALYCEDAGKPSVLVLLKINICCYELRYKNSEGGDGIMDKFSKAIMFKTLVSLVGWHK